MFRKWSGKKDSYFLPCARTRSPHFATYQLIFSSYKMAQLRKSSRLAATGTAETKADSSIEEEAPKTTEKKPSAAKSSTKEIEVGDSVPDITLLDENSEEVSLADVAKKSKFLVIFAYPKASTPGCTKQAKGFQSNYADLKALDTAVYGLSADSPKSQMNFVTKQGLKYPLLSDPTRKLISVLGAKKSPSGIKRSHWIFVDGVLKVKKIQVSPDVSVSSALDDVRQFHSENGTKAE